MPPAADPLLCVRGTQPRASACAGAIVSGPGASRSPLADVARRSERVRWRVLHPHLLEWSCPRRRPEPRSTITVPPVYSWPLPSSRACITSAAAAEARVEHVTKRVAEHVEAEHGE